MVVAAAGEDSFGPSCFKHRKELLHLPCGITEGSGENTELLKSAVSKGNNEGKDRITV